MSCSPDGHYVVICMKENNTVTFFSWHDGNLSGKVSLIINSIDGYGYLKDNVWITNSGRVWLCYRSSPSIYTIKVIDGTHVASGNISLRSFKEKGELNECSLDFYMNEEIISEEQRKGLQYWKLKVQDNKVLVQYSKLHKDNNLNNGDDIIFYKFNDSHNNLPEKANQTKFILPGTNRNVIYLENYLDKLEERKEYRFSYLPTGQQWKIISPKYSIMNPVCGTKDGKYVLLANMKVTPNFSRIYDFLSKFINIDNYDFMTSSQLALYNNNGEKVAKFPIRWDFDGLGNFSYSGSEYQLSHDVVLSPDGKRAGIKFYANDGYETGSVILGR
jgi:hypothetical protein